MVGFVEGRVASYAVVCSACGGVFIVLAGEGGFGSLFADDAELFYMSKVVSCEVLLMGSGGGRVNLPGERTACHS